MRKPFLPLVFSLLACLVTDASIEAAAGSVFTVDKMSVDASAASATQARAAALRDGQAQALEIVMKRLTLRAQWPMLPPVRELDVETFVEGFRVREEKTGRGRYLATLSVQFKPRDLSNLLRSYGVSISETQSPSVLLLPVLEDAKGLQAWGEHWWRQSWAARDLDNLPAPMTLPLGDLDDTVLMSAEDVLIGNPMKLAELNARYGTQTAIIAHALADIDGQLGITAYIFSETQSDVIVLTYRSDEAHMAMAKPAIDQLIHELDDRWKRVASVASDDRLELQVKVSFEDLQGWRRQLAKLEAANLIRETVIVEMTARYAYVGFSYIGSLEQLTSNVAQAGLQLEASPSGWQLTETQEY
ncbi:DUF2066 domain-containing protein [Alphaproteobacteria bacterium]|nr:DUF2066 domain-containing protein [Alphaproteobacteria bacterium]